MTDCIIRYAKKPELDRVNKIRLQVNNVHANGRPNIFRNDFCDESRT